MDSFPILYMLVRSLVLILSDLKMERIYLCILGVLRMHFELIFSYIT